MAKAPTDLDIGDILYVRNGKKYLKINGIQSWMEYYNDTVGASATISNRKIQDLDSGTSYVFFIESVEVLRDINLTLKFRNEQQQGAQGGGTITITENGLGDPLMLNKWCYNEPWYATLTNNLALALTAQNLAIFRGIRIYVEELSGAAQADAEKCGNFTPVDG